LLSHVEMLGATWFSHVDVPGALGSRSCAVDVVAQSDLPLLDAP
jgi:hypothetical protein